MTKIVSSLRESVIKHLDPSAKPYQVTVPRSLIALCDGDHLAAMFLSQCLYWTDRTQDRDGWFSKSFKEWDDELGMSTFQVRRAVNALKACGMEVKKRRSQYHSGAPTLHYRLNQRVMWEHLTAFAERQLASYSLKEETRYLEQAVSRKTYTETTAKKKEKESPAETSSGKALVLLSPDGDARAEDASQRKREQGQDPFAVKADDSFKSESLHNREKSLPVSSAEGPLAALRADGERGDKTTPPPASLRRERGEGQSDVAAMQAKSAAPASIAHSHGKQRIEVFAALGPKMPQKGYAGVSKSVLPRATLTPATDTRAAGKLPLSSPAYASTGGKLPPASPLHELSPMQAAVTFAFKIPQGPYAGKLGQFFAAKMPRNRKDPWTHHQPQKAATPQEVIGLYVWYSSHLSYVKSCTERGSKLPSTPSILRDRLDEFRDSAGYLQAIQMAAPLLEKLMRGEAVTAPVVPPPSTKPTNAIGAVESAQAYTTYDRARDPLYQRNVDSEAAARAFDQLFGS